MSDSVKKWYEMKEEGWWTKNPDKQKTVHSHMYVWVLDYEDAKVYCYNKWDPDTMSIKEFLITVGHTPKTCKWMINPSKKVNYII
jgi:hypothetical protein